MCYFRAKNTHKKRIRARGRKAHPSVCGHKLHSGPYVGSTTVALRNRDRAKDIEFEDENKLEILNLVV